MSLPIVFKTYRTMVSILEPAVLGLLYWRRHKGREDRTRPRRDTVASAVWLGVLLLLALNLVQTVHLVHVVLMYPKRIPHPYET